MADNNIINSLIEQKKLGWIKSDLLPLFSLLNIEPEAVQSGRFYFTFPLSKEIIIENLCRVTGKHKKLIEEDLSKFDDNFQDYYDIKIISNDENYKHKTQCNSYWHNINYCKSTKDSEIYYILKSELINASNNAFNDLKLSSNKILKNFLLNIKIIEDLIFLAIIKFASKENQYRREYNFEAGCFEEDNNFKICSDLFFLLESAKIDEGLIYYYLSNKPLIIEFEKILRILGKDKRFFATLFTHSFVSTSCVKSNNIIIEDRIAKRIIEILDKFPIEKWLNISYNEIKMNLDSEKETLPLFDNTGQFKLLKRVNDVPNLCVFDIEHNLEMMKALDFFKKSHILKVIKDNIIKEDDNKFNYEYNKLQNEENERIGKNKRKMLTKWLRWTNNAFKNELNRFIELLNKTDIETQETLIKPQTKIEEVDKKIVAEEEIKGEVWQIMKEDIIIGNSKPPKQWGILGISNDKKVIMDLNAPHVFFITGMMGAGKGYTIGVISEMLLSLSIDRISKVDKRATIIVLYKPKDDVPSEFWSIRFANDNNQEIQNLKQYGTNPRKIIEENQFRVFLDPNAYSKYIEVFENDYKTKNILPIQIDPSTLIAEDWANSLATGDNEALYIKTIFKIFRELPLQFNIEDVKQKIDTSDLNKNQKGLAKNRLMILEDYFKLEDFIKNLIIGGVNVFDFRKCMYQPDDIFIIMTLIISKLQNKQELEDEQFVFIMNEAHMYFKKGISKEFLDNIDNLIRRKRHGANWLLLDTHLPTDVDPKVIKLADIKVIHFTDKTVESKILNKILEDSNEKPYELETGECIVFSNVSSIGLSKPIKVKVRPRITKHGGATKTAIK